VPGAAEGSAGGVVQRYELRAGRAYAELRAKKVISKDLDIERLFEDATIRWAVVAPGKPFPMRTRTAPSRSISKRK
jgi:hypothetical protein